MKEPERLTAAKTVENKPKKTRGISVRKLKYGSVATAITAVFIAIVIIINVLVGVASEKVNLRLDYTEDQVYTLCDETLSFLNEMPGTAELIILGNESDFRSQVSNSNSISPYHFIVETTDN